MVFLPFSFQNKICVSYLPFFFSLFLFFLAFLAFLPLLLTNRVTAEHEGLLQYLTGGRCLALTWHKQRKRCERVFFLITHSYKNHGGRRLTNLLTSENSRRAEGENSSRSLFWGCLNQSKGFLGPDYFAPLEKKEKKNIACIFYQSVVFKSHPFAERKPTPISLPQNYWLNEWRVLWGTNGKKTPFSFSQQNPNSLWEVGSGLPGWVQEKITENQSLRSYCTYIHLPLYIHTYLSSL